MCMSKLAYIFFSICTLCILAHICLAANEPVIIDYDMPMETVCEPETEVDVESLGIFKLTAYCSCKKCCGIWAENRPNGVVYGASGEELVAGYSIAVDPDVIPYGTEVVINGHTYRADDCGGAVKGKCIDVYFESHNEAKEFGVKTAEVWLSGDKERRRDNGSEQSK